MINVCAGARVKLPDVVVICREPVNAMLPSTLTSAPAGSSVSAPAAVSISGVIVLSAVNQRRVRSPCAELFSRPPRLAFPSLYAVTACVWFPAV